MHAMTAIFSMDPAKKAFLMEGLEPVVIGPVREMPGYTFGLWSWDHAANVTYSFVVFDTEEHAHALESQLKRDAESLAAMGTRLERAVVAEVIGFASGNGATKLDGPDLWKRLASR
jgi:hypothetical protein